MPGKPNKLRDNNTKNPRYPRNFRGQGKSKFKALQERILELERELAVTKSFSTSVTPESPPESSNVCYTNLLMDLSEDQCCGHAVNFSELPEYLLGCDKGPESSATAPIADFQKRLTLAQTENATLKFVLAQRALSIQAAQLRKHPPTTSDTKATAANTAITTKSVQGNTSAVFSPFHSLVSKQTP